VLAAGAALISTPPVTGTRRSRRRSARSSAKFAAARDLWKLVQRSTVPRALMPRNR